MWHFVYVRLLIQIEKCKKIVILLNFAKNRFNSGFFFLQALANFGRL